MNRPPFPFMIAPLTAVFCICATSCTTHPPTASRANRATFQGVLPLLETNCIHCHGDQHLPSMPAFTDTKSISALIGPEKVIVPGQPESSRFFQVVNLADNQAGAMPPTGHAISEHEVETLRTWIQGGALLPTENLSLRPRGSGIRSR